jgi:t-SNARE complex subunit (syntaxin)
MEPIEVINKVDIMEEYEQIEKDMKLVQDIMNEINNIIHKQQQPIDDIQNSFENVKQTIQQSESTLIKAKKLQEDESIFKTVLYTAGTSTITGIIGITVGLKPALITGVVTGGLFIGYKFVKFMYPDKQKNE